jgi:hypothetical protein
LPRSAVNTQTFPVNDGDAETVSPDPPDSAPPASVKAATATLNRATSIRIIRIERPFSR